MKSPRSVSGRSGDPSPFDADEDLDAPPLRQFRAEDFQKRTGEVQEAALVEPVEITFRGRPRHVLMSVAEYRRLKMAPPPLRLRLSEIPDDLLAELAAAKIAPHDEPKD